MYFYHARHATELSPLALVISTDIDLPDVFDRPRRSSDGIASAAPDWTKSPQCNIVAMQVAQLASSKGDASLFTMLPLVTAQTTGHQQGGAAMCVMVPRLPYCRLPQLPAFSFLLSFTSAHNLFDLFAGNFES